MILLNVFASTILGLLLIGWAIERFKDNQNGWGWFCLLGGFFNLAVAVNYLL